MKSNSDNPFLSFLKKGKSSWKIFILLLVGVCLLLFGGVFDRTDSSEEYSYDEEIRLTQLCSRVRGVGECYVMIGYSSEGSSRYSASERRVESVVVVCQGADSVSVRQELTDIIVSLYGIGSNRVAVRPYAKK